MLKTISTDVLINNKISAHQYLIVCLLFEQKYDVLDNYLKKTNTYEQLDEDLTNLSTRGFIHYNSELFPYNSYKSILVSNTNVKLLGKYSNFDEIYNLYPVKVRRPDGKEAFLRKDRKTSEQIYSIIVKENKETHDHILKLLKLELQDREKTNTLGYMKTLVNWLSNREWRDYEDVVDDASYKKDKYLYGTNIE